jgi:hypothetical protein
VKLKVDPKYKELFLAAGRARRRRDLHAAPAMLHILRKVIMRVGTKLDYLILKLH